MIEQNILASDWINRPEADDPIVSAMAGGYGLAVENATGSRNKIRQFARMRATWKVQNAGRELRVARMTC